MSATKRTSYDAEVTDAILSVSIGKGNWMNKLLAGDSDDVTLIIAEIANRHGIDTRSFKRARIELSSFCSIRWHEFVIQAGLPDDVKHLRLDKFATPVYALPPSFHKSIYENSWRTLDVYGEKIKTHEAASVRLLDSYIVPILALFQGRVIDNPENRTTRKNFSTGGDVEHEIIMIGGILFVVIEAKLGMLVDHNLAQLFLEL